MENDIIQLKGYKIFNIIYGKYMGEPWSFIANYKNAHDKLLFFRRKPSCKNEKFEIHQFVNNVTDIEILLD